MLCSVGKASISRPQSCTLCLYQDRELEAKGFLGVFEVQEAWSRAELVRIFQSLPEVSLGDQHAAQVFAVLCMYSVLHAVFWGIIYVQPTLRGTNGTMCS